MARKSRKNVISCAGSAAFGQEAHTEPETAGAAEPFRAAIYARLSMETEYSKECDTVETQIALMENFVSESADIVTAGIYCDTSVSGTSFDRPEFERMMNDIRMGRVNMVITKDLSRLGRNYLETGNFIERVFPFFGVRYYAVTDDYDSFRQDGDLVMPLKNIVNEYYAKDISKKVHSGYVSSWQQGNHCCHIPPYGYKKDGQNNHRLVINEETAPVVKRIYAMFLEDGMGYNQIAAALRKEGILSPSEYNAAMRGETESAKKAPWYWRHVKRILECRYNTGDSIHGKTKRVLGNRKKNLDVSPEEWVIVAGTHEAVVDMETFERAQERIEEIRREKSNKGKKKNNTLPDNHLHLKCRCGICGKVMRMRERKKDGAVYGCSHSTATKKYEEKSTIVPFSDVEMSVFQVIHRHMQTCIEKERIIRKLNSRKESRQQYRIYAAEIARLRSEAAGISRRKAGLYEDYTDSLISAAEYEDYKKKYELAVQDINARLEQVLSYQAGYVRDFHINEDWEKAVDRFIGRRKLSTDMVEAFVANVYVYAEGVYEVDLKYDDFLEELVQVAGEREAECNAG
ncbi:MAG: recombinase family protein [Clostridium sp.]|nr:recombinase family protein [Clostridium sp.]